MSIRNSILSLLACVLISSNDAAAAELMSEPFTYANGDLATVSGGAWAVVSGAPSLNVAAGALAYNAAAGVLIDGTYRRTFSSSTINSGELFASFDLTVTDAPSSTTPANITFFANEGTVVRSRVWIRRGSAVNTFQVGITGTTTSTASVVWFPDTFTEGSTTVKVVHRFDFTTGRARLYINPTDVDSTFVDSTEGTTNGLKAYALRHMNGTSTTNSVTFAFTIDNLLIGETISDVGIGTPPPPPPPSVPSGLTATAVPGSRIYLRWNDTTSDEGGFAIERREEPAGSFAPLHTTAANEDSYVDENIVPGATYTYRVHVDPMGNTVPSNEATATALPAFTATLEQPKLRIEKTAPGEVTLSFQSAPGISYALLSRIDSNPWTPEGLPIGGTGEVISTTRPYVEGQAKYFRVVATTFERPSNIGLTMPFAHAASATGTTLSVVVFGAVPDDGIDDWAAFDAALSAANSGDEVFVPNGTYRLSSRLTPPNGVTLRGESRDGTVILGIYPLVSGSKELIKISKNRTDVILTDFSLALAPGSTAPFARGIVVGDSSSAENENPNRIRIENIKVTNFSERGIEVRKAHHVLVANCICSDASAVGGGGEGYGVTLTDEFNNNNWVTGNTLGPGIRHGVLIQFSAHNNLIENNVAFDNVQDAYDLHGEDEYNNELRFNLAYDCDRAGFGVGNTGSTHDKSGPNNWIHHNEVYNCLEGIELIQGSDVQYIEYNHFHGNTAQGVEIEDGGGDFVFVRGNESRGNNVGLYAESARHLVVDSNVLSGNTGYGVETAPSVEQYRIVGNDLRGNGMGAASLGSPDGEYSGNVE